MQDQRPECGASGTARTAHQWLELWQAYLDYLSPVREGSKPVVSIDLDFERVITHKTNNGDYDPGIVHADLELQNLKAGTTFLTDYDKFAIKDFVVGNFDRDATREQIQETAFAATEEGAMRFVIYSLDLGVIRAMSDEGRKGRAFIPALQEKREALSEQRENVRFVQSRNVLFRAEEARWERSGWR